MTVPENFWRMTACALGAGIEGGRIDPVALAEACLARAREHDREARVYLRLCPERALAEAEAARERARRGLRRSALDGVPVAWKDLFDTAQIATTHGSKLLENRVPRRDAEVVARATRAGLVCLGKTNQTEFAFSGLGINPAFGTPANPFDAETPRVPGGSSAGSAVAVARGLAAAGAGSDTGGSCRIPAAWNGLVGLKTSFGRLPLGGVLPLSPSFDTVGVLTRDVADAAALDAVLAAEPAPDLEGASAQGLVLGVARTLLFDDAEAGVAAAIEAAFSRLASSGARLVETDVPEFAEADALLSRYGSFISAECYAIWGALAESRPNLVFHQVLERMREGLAMNAADAERLRHGLRALSRRFGARLGGLDALLGPTVAISPPPVAVLEADDRAYRAANAMALRNTRLANFLEACALSLPCGEDGAGLPVGLLLMARKGEDRRLLRVAAALERALGA